MLQHRVGGFAVYLDISIKDTSQNQAWTVMQTLTTSASRDAAASYGVVCKREVHDSCSGCGMIP